MGSSSSKGGSRDGSGGEPFDAGRCDEGIRKVEIHHGQYIDAISVIWRRGVNTGKHGGDGGKKYTIDLALDEIITEIDVWHADVVDAIQVTTSRKKHPKLGGAGGAHESIKILPGKQITAITGRAGTLVDAVVITQSDVPASSSPKKKARLPPSPARATLTLPGCMAMTELKAIQFFDRSCGPRFVASRVTFLPAYPPSLMQLISGHMLLQESRRDLLPHVFSPSNPSDVQKNSILNVLKTHMQTQHLAGMKTDGQPFVKANMLLAWHGAKEAVADHILQTGFAYLGALDPGYNGAGRYLSLEAEYAAMYASEYPDSIAPNSSGEWPVILSAVAIGLAWPVTACREDYPTGALPPTDPQRCQWYGKPLKIPCDTHVVPVSPPDYLPGDLSKTHFHELVLDSDAQVLPLCIVWFKRC